MPHVVRCCGAKGGARVERDLAFDRGDAVVQVAPPLISTADQLDEMVDALGEVLTEAGQLMGLTAS